MQVAIVGARTTGLLLGALLGRAGIESVIVERHGAAHVLGHIRPGMQEQVPTYLLAEAGTADRLHRGGLRHDDGIELCFGDKRHRVDLSGRTGGRHVTVYGQTEVTRELMHARAADGLVAVYQAAEVAISDLDARGRACAI
jgi:p-hydroxybenzoate 3-monooxygenase